ncbi:MAG: hypothetical protein M1455_08655 [Actinobacteria bacterium]|nr:hypothetical protein [Actinomycetota bacterium]
MSKQEILYVAYRDEALDDGISYATYLSNLLGERLTVILLSRGGFGRKLNDLMSAVTFAEANEHETAQRILSHETDSNEAAAIQNYVMQKCASEGIEASVHIGLEATVTVVMNFLRQKKVDMVLLSPEVTESRSLLKKLVKSSPRPVITMARGASSFIPS